MRILLVAIHHPVGAARYMADAFRRLGHDVRSVGPARGADIWDMRLAPSRVWNPDGPLDAYWTDWDPDLVLVMETSFPYHHPRYADVPHALYTVDNHVADVDQPGISHYFLAHRRGPAMPVVGPRRTWLPCGYDPVLFTPSRVPWRDRKHDVSLIGVMYPSRIALLQALRQRGVHVFAGTGAVYEEFRDVYHQTRISLSLTTHGDVPQRLFETAATGCVVLSNPCDDFDQLRPDGVVEYRFPDECADAIRHLLSDPALAESLAARSAAWAGSHTWDARAATILDWLRGK
jgi:hypothetical protein